MQPRMRRLVFAAFALVLSCLGVQACGSGPAAPTPVSSSPVGRYNLVTAKGQALPAVVYQAPSTGYRQEVTGGFVELRAGSECSWGTDYRYTDSGRVTTSSSGDTGMYTLSGSRLLMTFRHSQIEATLSGDTLTIMADVEMVYRR